MATMGDNPVVSAAPELLSTCMKIIEALHEVRPRLRPAPVTMTSITTECFTLHEALSQAQGLSITPVVISEGEESHQIMRRIRAFFLGCSMTISVVDEYVMELVNAIQKPATVVEAKQVWREDDMKELLSQIRGYRLTLATLLEALQSDNIAEEAHRVTAGDQAAIVTLIDRSRSSFLIRPTSTCSSLRGSLLDPSPPYALSLHGDFADAARLYTSEIDANVITPLPDTSEDESISPAVADPGQSEVLESRTDRATTDRDASSGAVADEQSLAVILEASSEPVTEISAADSARSGLQNFSFPSWSRYIPSTTSTAEGFLRDPIIDPTHIASKSAFSPIARGNHIPGSRDGDDRSCSEIVFTLSDDHGPGDFPDSDVLISQPPGAHTYLIADQQEHPVNADGINQSPVPNSVKEKQKEERSDLSTPVHKPRFETRSVKPCPKTQVHRQHKIAIIGGPASNKDELINRFLQRGPHDKLQENHNFKDCVVDGNTATIEIMASPGLEHYSAMHDTFLGAGQGYLLVYSPASRQSFEEIRSLYVRIERLKFEISETYNRQPYPAYTPPPSQYEVGSRWPRVLVSNGGHSKNLRQVSHHEELEMARSLDCPLIKVSEQHYWTVEKAFYDLIRDICEQHFTPKIPTPVVLDKVEPVESRKPARPFWHRRSWKG